MKTNYDEEIWKPIKGYEGLYEVSNLGRIKNSKTNKLIKSKKPNLQHQVCLRKDMKTNNLVVAKIMIEAFYNMEYNSIVHFKDKNVDNLYLSNIYLANTEICDECGEHFKGGVQAKSITKCPRCSTNMYFKTRYKNHTEKVRKCNDKWKNNNLDKVKILSINNSRKHREHLSDCYVAFTLYSQGYRKNELNSEIIETKRNIIKIKRLCRQLKN